MLNIFKHQHHCLPVTKGQANVFWVLTELSKYTHHVTELVHRAAAYSIGRAFHNRGQQVVSVTPESMLLPPMSHLFHPNQSASRHVAAD